MAAVDPFHSEVQDSLVASVLYLLDDPASRAYIRPNSDLLVRGNVFVLLGLYLTQNYTHPVPSCYSRH